MYNVKEINTVYIFFILIFNYRDTPFVGYLCECGRFMFMERKFGKDGPKMEKYFDELKENKYPTTLIFFPEGTTIDVETRKVSQKFSVESNRQVFNVIIIIYIIK